MKKRTCPTCNGWGGYGYRSGYNTWVNCPTCEGHGDLPLETSAQHAAACPVRHGDTVANCDCGWPRGVGDVPHGDGPTGSAVGCGGMGEPAAVVSHGRTLITASPDARGETAAPTPYGDLSLDATEKASVECNTR